MREMQYPQSCSAKTIVEFGNTLVGFGSEDVSLEEMTKFLDKTLLNMRRTTCTYCTALLNNDQDKKFHELFLSKGFNCVSYNMYHPKYGKSVSFYLLTIDWGDNPSSKGKRGLNVCGPLRVMKYNRKQQAADQQSNWKDIPDPVFEEWKGTA